ncbi:hypothetical protein [Sodalis sp. RH22]|uniref:hypothetical protein n=1 Tax=unclassified Sodalis (in: enterobacteria) TaxID=2636512 RepID=UPI0039B46FFB
MGNIISQTSIACTFSYGANLCGRETQPRQNNYRNALVLARPAPVPLFTRHVTMAGDESRADSGAAPVAAVDTPGDRGTNAPQGDVRALLAAKGMGTDSFEQEYSQRSLTLFFALAGKSAHKVKNKYHNRRDKNYLYFIKSYAELHYLVQDYIKNNPEKTIITAPIYFSIMKEMGVILATDIYDQRSHFNTGKTGRLQDKLESISERLRECLDKMFANVFSPGNHLLKYLVVPFMSKYLALAHSLSEETFITDLPAETALGQYLYERLLQARNEHMSTPRETNNISAIIQMGEDINLISRSVKLFLA